MVPCDAMALSEELSSSRRSDNVTDLVLSCLLADPVAFDVLVQSAPSPLRFLLLALTLSRIKPPTKLSRLEDHLCRLRV